MRGREEQMGGALPKMEKGHKTTASESSNEGRARVDLQVGGAQSRRRAAPARARIYLDEITVIKSQTNDELARLNGSRRHVWSSGVEGTKWPLLVALLKFG